jgi:hypothetical protein
MRKDDNTINLHSLLYTMMNMARKVLSYVDGFSKFGFYEQGVQVSFVDLILLQ